MEQRTEGDVARVLSGKASGVNITSQSGTSGSATNVVIRGYTSINGNNQALFVVDGVPTVLKLMLKVVSLVVTLVQVDL